MNKIIVFVLLALLTGTATVVAQDNLLFPSQSDRVDSTTIVSYLNSHIEGQGTVEMIHDAQIDSIIELSRQVLAQDGDLGYSVQLFRGNNGQISRRSAEKIKSEYLQKNPEGSISVVYTKPDWRVHVGNYRTYAEALKVKMQLQKQMSEYQDQIYIVRVRLDFSEK